MEDIKFDPSLFVDEKEGRITDVYKLGNPLGDGAFGVVRRGTHKKTGALRAVKTLSKDSVSKSKEHKKFFAEVEILKSLDHPHIAKLQEFQQDKKDYHLVMELSTGGELFDAIIDSEKFSEKRAAIIISDLLSAVNYMHSRGIVHRDLKPENILLESKKPNAPMKLIDFGTARVQQNTEKKKMNERLGSAQYIAPEVIKRSQTSKCDVWSCGVILQVLLCGQPPFNGNTDNDIMKSVSRGKQKFDPEDWNDISSESKDLIARMMTVDPSKRISAEQALQHQWIKSMTNSEAADKQLINSSLSRLKKFRTGQKLAKATWTQIASQLTSEKDKEELTKVFKSLDANNDGKLSREELIAGQIDTLGSRDLACEEVDNIMKVVDVDKSGFLDQTEFVAATMNRDLLCNNNNLQVAFSLFDKDSSGAISTSELRSILGGDESFTDEQWKSMVREVDKNNDGEIDFEEFKEMMKNINM